MTSPGRLRLPAACAALVASLALAPLSARADGARTTAPPATLAGNWRFETDAFHNSCTISGVITFRPTAAADRFDCEFVSTQVCPQQPETVRLKVKQSCSAIRSGRQVGITSKVERILEVSPASLRAAAESPDGYAPDNFVVALAPGGRELVGLFHSLARSRVRFWREEDLTS